MIKFLKRIKDIFIVPFKVFKSSFSEGAKFNVIKTVVDGHPFDYSYFWEIERAKLIEMRDYFKESNISTYDEQIYKEIRLAVKLLDIVIDETNLFHFEDPYPNENKESVWSENDNNSKFSTSKFNSKYWIRHHQYKSNHNFKSLIDEIYGKYKNGEDIYLECYCAPLPCHGDIIKKKIEKRLLKEKIMEVKNKKLNEVG